MTLSPHSPSHPPAAPRCARPPRSKVRGGVIIHAVITPTMAAKRMSPTPRKMARATMLAPSDTWNSAATRRRRTVAADTRTDEVKPAAMSGAPAANATEQSAVYAPAVMSASHATRPTSSSRRAPTAWPASTCAPSAMANAGKNEN